MEYIYKGKGVIDDSDYTKFEQFNKAKTEKLAGLYKEVLQVIDAEPERDATFGTAHSKAGSPRQCLP